MKLAKPRDEQWRIAETTWCHGYLHFKLSFADDIWSALDVNFEPALTELKSLESAGRVVTRDLCIKKPSAKKSIPVRTWGKPKIEKKSSPTNFPRYLRRECSGRQKQLLFLVVTTLLGLHASLDWMLCRISHFNFLKNPPNFTIFLFWIPMQFSLHFTKI